ncbi:MAG: sigma 54-interacting transcriptional regulator [Desulfobacterales bacterium]
MNARMARTMFLDEVGELPAEAQVRLLRVLQEKEIDRVGGTGPVKVDIRIIAATHRNLETMLDLEKFRKDLYFRLRVFPIVIPPLRMRIADIPALVQHFICKKSGEMKLKTVPVPAPGALERLMSYSWPGNVRELENAVERAIILSRGKPLTFSDVFPAPCGLTPLSKSFCALSGDRESPPDLDTVMTRHIRQVLDMCNGRVEGEKGAARLLNIHPSTLRKRMRKLGIPFGRRQKDRNPGNFC